MNLVKPRRILLVSVSIGTGHTQAALAIEEYWRRKYPDAEIRHVDFIEQDSLSIDKIMKETYIKVIDVFPMLYDMFYRFTQKDRKGSVLQTGISWAMKNRMLRLIRQENPDIVVMTHPFPCGAASILKRQKLISVPLVAMITDFTVHSLWRYKEIDLYCVGADHMVAPLHRTGIPRDKIVVTGIPVKSVFFTAKKENYSLSRPVKVLLMGGGLGLGSYETILECLDKVKQIDELIVISGHNASLYNMLVALKQKLHTPMVVYGYSTEIPQLMQEAALLVTKPGALTCMEAITVGLPMVLFDAIPGQEEANAAFMEEAGYGRWARDIHNLEDVVTALLADEKKLIGMSRREKEWQVNGAANVVQAIETFLTKKMS